VSADYLAELRKQYGVLARFVRVIHAGELSQGICELSPVIGVFERLKRGELKRLIGHAAPCLMLLEKHIDQVHELARFSKTREKKVLFQLFVVVLDEAANDFRRIGYRIRGQIRIGINSPGRFSVDEQHALEHAMLAHQIFSWRDFLFLFLFSCTAKNQMLNTSTL
jgi:hypothetical protein